MRYGIPGQVCLHRIAIWVGWNVHSCLLIQRAVASLIEPQLVSFGVRIFKGDTHSADVERRVKDDIQPFPVRFGSFEACLPPRIC